MAKDESRVSVRSNPLEPHEGQSRGYHQANLRRQKDGRNMWVLECWKNGMNIAQITRQIEKTEYGKLSYTTVKKIVKRELNKAAEERQHIALEIFDGEL